jgi:N-acetylglucosaminyldiphosphoundecaprenol N-acetyl-beta-D-mannosaminyltransferase
LGAALDDLSAVEIVAEILRVLDCGGRARVINANAYMLNLTFETPWLRDLFRQSEITFFDGAGAQLAAQFLTGRRPRRTTPPEWAAEVAAGVAQRGGSVYLLGGEATAAAAAAARLSSDTSVRVAGYHHGFFDPTPGSAEARAVIDEINRLRPAVLFLNMGMPRQERWLFDYWDQIDVPVAVTAGALVDHLAGRVRRPPRWVADLGLEWLVRLAVEPKRLWRRYVIGLPVFGWRVLGERRKPRQWDAGA